MRHLPFLTTAVTQALALERDDDSPAIIRYMGALNARSQSGPPDLQRLSVGLEGPGDLCADLDATLRRAQER